MAGISEIIGKPPLIQGCVIDELLVSECWVDGDCVSPANAIYLRVDAVWHQSCIDGTIIFWYLLDARPEPYFDPEEGVEIPIVDIGVKYGVKGIVLERYEMASLPDGLAVQFYFSNGICITNKSVDDYQTLEYLPAQ